MKPSKTTTSLLGVALASILTLTACGGGSDDSDSQASSEESSSQADSGSGQPPKPDLEGIPEVVADVNGEEVTKDEFVPTYQAQFQQAAMQAQMSQQQPDEEQLKKQAAEGLVDTELLRQEADERGISASDKDVDNELTSLAKQNQMASAKEFLAALKKQGSSEDVVRDQVETQVVVERLIKDEAGPIKPTEAELRKIYDAAVKQQKAAKGAQKQAIPPFDKVKPQLVQQATSDKQNQTAQALVAKLRKGAEITINL